MIISKLSITNFRNYSGTTDLDLSIDKSRNMILFGGQNGAGKTSMVDAIRLCLYGQKMDGEPLSESKYQEYIGSVCNRHSDGHMSISLDIILNEENPPIELNIERRFLKKGSKFNEELLLRRSGSKVEFIDQDYWSFYVEKIIPPSSSRYFFFDGERVRDTISSEDSQQFLSDAVDNLTGVSSLRILKKDLQEVRKRILSKSKGADSESIVKLRGSIDALGSEISSKESSITDNEEFLNQYQVNYNSLEEERARLIGATNDRREEINNRLGECTSNFDDSNRVLSDFCYSSLPFFLGREAIKRTVKQAEDENSNIIYQYSISALKGIYEDSDQLKKIGKNEKTSRETIDKIIDLFSGRIQSTDRPLDIPLSKIEQLKGSVPSVEDMDGFMEAVRNREFYTHEIVKYNKQLDKLTDDSLKELDQSLLSLRTEMEVLKRQIEIDRSQVQSLQNKQSVLRGELAREERMLVLEDVDKESLRNIELVSSNIDHRIEIIISDARSNLERKINEIYHVLKNTKDMVKSVRINESFGIELIDFDDKIIDIKFISEGEKGILMYSVVFALHSISESNFPLIVDSPLGRMDTKHVHNLAEKYFPSIPSQIILLSHDREVIGESLDLLSKNINHTYLIRKSEVPKVINGYFE